MEEIKTVEATKVKFVPEQPSWMGEEVKKFMALPPDKQAAAMRGAFALIMTAVVIIVIAVFMIGLWLR